MGREWETGDVAMVRSKSVAPTHAPVPVRAVRAGGRVGQQGYAYWLGADGLMVEDKDVAEVRPLVVIDPEDREQVQRLTDFLYDNYGIGDHDATTDHLTAALREFVNPTPPKPPEPQGLGAVVEDANGWRWVKTGGPNNHPWVSNDDDETRAKWSYITAVKVLSEGVTP